MDGLYYIKIAANHLEEMKRRISDNDFEDFQKEIREVMEAMHYLWDWIDAKQDKPR